MIIETLGLVRHPEGGWYAETYRNAEMVQVLPDRYHGPRSLGTAIYFLLEGDDFSAMHRLASDEVYHFYLGDPVEMLLLHPDGRGEMVILGPGLDQGEHPQAIVPAGVWQGFCLREGGRFALLGTTVAPGFDFADFELGRREELTRTHRAWSEHIGRLTRT